MNELILKLSDFLKKKEAMEVIMIPKTIQLTTRSYKL
jgi:hypothetical protein